MFGKQAIFEKVASEMCQSSVQKHLYTTHRFGAAEWIFRMATGIYELTQFSEFKNKKKKLKNTNGKWIELTKIYERKQQTKTFFTKYFGRKQTTYKIENSRVKTEI